jgi:hypothetical protein
MGVSMNKLLVVIGLVMSLNVQAKAVVEAANQGGGKLVLTDEFCNDNQHKLAYSQTNTTSTLFGCWTGDGKFIHIRWYDGDLRSYPYEIWQVINNPMTPTM